MVISSKFCTRQYSDDDHQENAPHFTTCIKYKTTGLPLNHKKEPFFSIKMDLIIDFFKLGFLIISYRRRFCFFSLHHLFFRFLETTKTSPNSLKTSINTKGYADRNFSKHHKDSLEKN